MPETRTICLSIDGHDISRVTIMKQALPMEMIKVVPSYRARKANAGLLAAVQDSARIQGGNWSMKGLPRSGHVHDECESPMSIAEFTGRKERFESVE